jgi:hypothetical protein
LIIVASIFKHKAWLITAGIIALAYCFIEAEGKGDFYIFMSASGQLLRHNNIYYYQYMDSYNYFYSVLFALVLAPCYTLPFFWVKLGWLILNMCLYAHLFKLLAESTPVKALNQKQARLFLFCLFLFSFRFLHENIHASQVSILILWCCVYGLYCIQQDKPVKGSALLALGINIKLLPVVLLPYLLYRGYFKAFSYTVLFYALAMFLPSFIIGQEYNIELIRSWLQLINPLQKRHILDVDERSFHSLTTLLSTLMVEKVPDFYAMPLKRNIADVSLAALSQIILITRAMLVLLTLYFVKWPPFVKARSVTGGLAEVSYLLLLIPLIFPHQQHYAFLFAVPAFAVVLYVLLKEPPPGVQKPVVMGLLGLIYLCTNLKLLLGEFNGYYEHYKILTYGALLLIPLLIWALRHMQKTALLVPEN